MFNGLVDQVFSHNHACCCEDDKAAFCQVNTLFALQKLGHVGCGSAADDGIRKPPIGQLEDNPAGFFIVGDHSMSGRANACDFPTPKAQIIIFGNEEGDPQADRREHLALRPFTDEALGATDVPHRRPPQGPKGGVCQ